MKIWFGKYKGLEVEELKQSDYGYVSWLLKQSWLNPKLRRELEDKEIAPGGGEFSQAEIGILIKLCHPDKHNGSQQATEITKKLLNMRKKL